MTKSLLHNIIGLLTSLVFLCLPAAANSQTVQFSMKVQPELEVEVLQNLNFGTVVTNSGVQRVNMGDSGMGVFKIKALATQHALLVLHAPDSLTISEPNQKTGIPFNVYAAYSASRGNYNGAEIFKDRSVWISFGSGGLQDIDAPEWEEGYVYIFGDIEIGNISQGIYSGTLTLSVEYQ